MRLSRPYRSKLNTCSATSAAPDSSWRKRAQASSRGVRSPPSTGTRTRRGAAGGIPRARRIGTGEQRTTRSAVLPSLPQIRPRRPCSPTTTRSALRSSATAAISRAARPNRTSGVARAPSHSSPSSIRRSRASSASESAHSRSHGWKRSGAKLGVAGSSTAWTRNSSAFAAKCRATQRPAASDGSLKSTPTTTLSSLIFDHLRESAEDSVGSPQQEAASGRPDAASFPRGPAAEPSVDAGPSDPAA